ncbi:MAG: PhzF family phenazine biosynthesis protein [Thermoanaerobaculaceae bacterium]|nr:PhzF family phenazine biosynthesis protein [Thermoanaerobaculaceae bacterium]TAM44993.1 MAG: PhzF family phenazine biosynthesis protein [Acidobacteriota bacterium]
MGIRAFKVDSFTAEPFAGNPAGVCLLPEPRPERWMQAVAREMNLSETAFLVREGAGFRLRWFTPAVEVALCGHATLAAAHVLWEAGILAPGEVACFATKSGELRAARRGELIELDFPVKPETAAAPPAHLLEAVGANPTYLGRNAFDYLLLLESEDAVRAVTPDFALLRRVDVRGVIVTAPASTPGYDFVSRFFAPAVGVDEDPVTGSAHCCLGPFWAARLGKTELSAYQASARGGAMRVLLAGDRVFLGGRAVTVLRGELAV